MAQNNSSSSDSQSQAESGETGPEIRARAARLQKKVGELSKTFERIEQTLADAGDDRKDPGA